MREKLTVFHLVNILLESLVHWISEDTFKFEIKVGFTRNMQKCNSSFDFLTSQTANYSSTLAWLIMTIESLQGACLFCAVWAILVSL